VSFDRLAVRTLLPSAHPRRLKSCRYTTCAVPAAPPAPPSSAVTAVIRLNYPATQRGAVVGTIRQWFYITSLSASALAAWALDLAKDFQPAMIKSQMLLAGVISAVSFLVFRTIRVRETETSPPSGTPFSQPWVEAWRIVRADGRFRLYLAIAFLYCFGDLLYASSVPVLFSRRLQLSYLASTFLISTLPTLFAILCTGQLGRWMDRVNTWKAWALIRLGWGFDPIMLAGASGLAGLHSILPVIPAVCGRISRGAVSGGSWILWWQVGVNHFAKPGGDSSTSGTFGTGPGGRGAPGGGGTEGQNLDAEVNKALGMGRHRHAEADQTDSAHFSFTRLIRKLRSFGTAPNRKPTAKPPISTLVGFLPM